MPAARGRQDTHENLLKERKWLFSEREVPVG